MVTTLILILGGVLLAVADTCRLSIAIGRAVLNNSS
jgi:hypothetical protein